MLASPSASASAAVAAASLSTAATPQTLALPDFSIFKNSAARQAHPAIVDADGTSVTYGSLLRKVALCRESYLDSVKPGDRVAFLYPRAHTYVVAQWSTWSRRAIAVPLCTTHPPHELAHVLSDAAPTTVLFHSSFKARIEETKTDPRVAPLVAGIRWVCADSFDADGEGQDAADAAAAPLVKVETEAIDKSGGALIIYTSGTTGKPKGVLTTFANIEAQVDSLHQAWRWTQDDRILLLLPLHHIHGIVNVLTCAVAAGATIEMAPEKFDPAWTWKRILRGSAEPATHGLTLFMAVPTIYAKLSQHYQATAASDADAARALTAACKQFRLMVSGSAALPTPLFDSWRELSGHALLERYGMTEVGMAIGNRYGGPREKGKVGVPFPGVEVRLVDAETGQPVPEGSLGVPGEVWVRGPQIFREYWNRPDATAEVLDADGWFRTGDIAALTVAEGEGAEPGMLSYQIMGRASVDIIKSGGFKLSALDIERELLAHPEITDAAVVGMPDDVYGERVVAVLVMGQGEPPAKGSDAKKAREAEIKVFLKSRLAGYQTPSVYWFVKEMPRNAMGKVNKKDLKKWVASQ
ncbi:putative long chain fatty acid CoA ligase [Zopfochytrium polystomum]|nr:putative long chain fatty acid CoA ligase [Zopfochytrium polystomum]